MMQRTSWLLLAALHLAPALALFGPSMLGRLYGVGRSDVSFPLLHHRAALFGVIVIVAVWAAFDPGVRRVASVAVALSMLSFLLIWWTNGAPSSLRGIAVADLCGLPVLAFAAWKAFAGPA
jgi:hypothetical protein